MTACRSLLQAREAFNYALSRLQDARSSHGDKSRKRLVTEVKHLVTPNAYALGLVVSADEEPNSFEKCAWPSDVLGTS